MKLKTASHLERGIDNGTNSCVWDHLVASNPPM